MIRKCQNCKCGVNSTIALPTDPPSSTPMTECHLIPPTILANAEGTIYHRIPFMQPESWCGQHKLSLWKLWSNG